MLTRLVNFAGRALQPAPVKVAQPAVSNNPFANPFVTSHDSSSARNTYGKNNPIAGGFFAGYHNGKPNIVGRKLFIEA